MKRRLNRTDRFLILILLSCIIGIALRVWELNGASKADQTLILEAEWRGVDVRTADCLSEGDLLYTAGGELYGSVRRIVIAPAEIKIAEGGVVFRGEAPIEEKCDVRVAVVFEGTERGGTFLHGGAVPVAVGERLLLYSDRCELSLLVLFCGESALITH